MKYTIEMQFVMDDKEKTKEELEEIIRGFLDGTDGDGYVKITDENGQVVEATK
jgi:hypothetical protein